MTQSVNKVFAGQAAALRDEDCANHADATSEMFSILCGRNRLFYELLTGWGPDGETAMSKRNPQNGIGIDHSGPPFGVNLRHTLWNYGSIHYLSNPTYVNQAKSVELSGDPTTILAHFYTKPFPKVDKTPIGQMTMISRIYNVSGSTTTISGKLSTEVEGNNLSPQTLVNNAGAAIIWNGAADAPKILSGFNRVRIDLTSSNKSGVWMFATSLHSIQKQTW